MQTCRYWSAAPQGFPESNASQSLSSSAANLGCAACAVAAAAVRALQLGLSVVPRVDPRVSRSLADYCVIYREWLLLLRGRLAQSGVELPEGLFDDEQAADEELMRFALCYNILQVSKGSGCRLPADALLMPHATCKWSAKT